MTMRNTIRRAVVTGASSGIGEALAWELARRGATVEIVARRKTRLEKLADAIHARGLPRPIVRVADLLNEVDLATLEGTWSESPPDLFVNNAGVGMNRPFLSSDLESMERLITLDLEVPMRLSRTVGGAMVERGWGAILNVASIAAFFPTPCHAVYSAAKTALLLFSESLDLELRPSGVTVTTLCPGLTNTEFFEAGDYLTDSLVYRMSRDDPKDVARAGIKGLLKGRVVVVPGIKLKVLLALQRLIPHRWLVAAAGKAMCTESHRGL